MSDPTPTRQETVEANIEAITARWGEEDFKHMVAQCIQDISVSLALLVDSGSSSGT